MSARVLYVKWNRKYRLLAAHPGAWSPLKRHCFEVPCTLTRHSLIWLRSRMARDQHRQYRNNDSCRLSRWRPFKVAERCQSNLLSSRVLLRYKQLQLEGWRLVNRSDSVPLNHWRSERKNEDSRGNVRLPRAHLVQYKRLHAGLREANDAGKARW